MDNMDKQTGLSGMKKLNLRSRARKGVAGNGKQLQPNHIVHQSPDRGSNQLAGYTNELDTPCRQMDALAIKPKQNGQQAQKKPKLLSSKSLSQLVPRSLFFKKQEKSEEPASTTVEKNTCRSAANMSQMPPMSQQSTNANGTTTTTNPFVAAVVSRLFPNAALDFEQNISISDETSSRIRSSNQQEPLVNRVNSLSLLGLPRASSGSSSSGYLEGWSLDRPAFSPLQVATRAQAGLSSTMVTQPQSSTTSSNTNEMRHSMGTISEETPDQPETASEPEKRRTTRGKAFKNTALVLRDVKNSIELRLRARHESRAFAKLDESPVASPNVSVAKLQQPTGAKETRARKTKTSLLGNSSGNKREAGNKKQPPNQSAASDARLLDGATPKGRVALQHKRHLMQANKFAFDSPTGRLRETVREVEQFQQCIEDISRAIKERAK